MSEAKTVEFEGVIHLVFSSHWDREWYMPFQKYRAKLVRILDEIFAELESGHLPCYQMDGQFIPVEDYLEIRPEKEALIRRLVGEGRFKVGPWYDLPDEFLVSGESIIRNFLMGMRRSKAFGQTSHAGWLCDIFGHNSQTPQLLTNLGIDNAILWRGVDLALGTPFQWASPDGTSILTHRFPSNGYCDFSINVRKAFVRGDYPDVEKMVDEAVEYLAKIAPTVSARTLLWFDGADHIDFDPAMVEFVARFNERAGREIVKISTLDAYLDELKAEAPAGQKTHEGELREACSMQSEGWLIPGVGSSRIPLKRSNHACETLLTLWAEPWCAIAARQTGIEYPAGALELAWEYLIKNHPHDSICGCSIDETHNAMPYRFDQSRQICEVYLHEALETMSAVEFADALQDEELGLSLYSAAGGSTQRSPEATLRLPAAWPQFQEFFGYENKPGFRLYSSDGQEVAYQLLQVTPQATHLRVARNKFPLAEPRQQVRIAIDTALEPAQAQHLIVKRVAEPTRIPLQGSIGIGRDLLRNEHLEVRACSDGTLTVTELGGGKSYSGLLAMEDTADIGDGWFHGVPVQDCGYMSTGGNITFGITENGPLLARLQMRVEWPVPRDFDFKNYKRSAELAPLVVEHLITLRKGADTVEIDTMVHNTVRDHRLRLFAPTGFANATQFWADTPFDAVARPIELRHDNHLLREMQVEMTPQQNWVATSDGVHGLALLSPGQYESAVLDQPDRPLCLTLLRAFRKAVFTDGNEGGQIQGSHTIKLGITPFQSSADTPVPATHLFQTAQSLAAPVYSLYIDNKDLLDRPVQVGATDVSSSTFPRVEGAVVLSAWQQAEPGQWSLRVYNPETAAAEVKLSGGANWKRTDFHGEGQGALDGTLTVKAKEIVTLQCAV